jgi:transposase-like protein
MQSNIRKVRKNRRFSKEFKQRIVEEYEAGKASTKELAFANNISQQTIYKWIYKLSKYNKKGYRVVEKVDSKSELVKKLTKENKDLKSIVGDKQIRIEYLERLIKVAEEELNIDFKKNSFTPQSNTSK